MIKIKKSTLLFLALLYSYIPVFLFLLTWVQWYIGFPVVALLAYIFLDCFRAIASKNDIIVISWSAFFVTVGLIVVFCMFLGYGHLYPQSDDHFKHNAILQDLVRYDWPVIYNEFEPCLLTYYLGDYLLPALFGKLTQKVSVAEYAWDVWSIGGIILVYYYILSILKANTWWQQIRVILLLFYFSGMLWIVQQLVSLFIPVMPSSYVLKASGVLLEYRAPYVQMFFVPNQCVVTWIVCLLLYEFRKKSKYFAFLVLPLLIISPWTFIGLLVYVLCLAIYNIRQKMERFAEYFSWQNISIALFPGMVFLIYLLGNIMQPKPESIDFQWAATTLINAILIVIFPIFMYGLPLVLLKSKRLKYNPFYIGTILSLIIIPFFTMGRWNDFVSCVSMPAIFYTMVFFLQNITYLHKTSKVQYYLCILCVLLGSVYPIEFYYKAIKNQPHLEHYTASLANDTDCYNEDIPVDRRYNYYTYHYNSSLFYKYIAKKTVVRQ